MKKAFIILSTILFFSCNNEGTKPPKEIKTDTTLTLAAYLGYGLRGVQFGPARRLERDSLAWDLNADTTKAEKKWKKVKWYEVSVDIQVDSSVAKVFNVPLLDSNGKKYFITRILTSDERFVREGITDIDSAIQSLKQYMRIDSIKK